MSKPRQKSIKYGDSRLWAETTTTEPFAEPNGVTHDTETVVRISGYIDIDTVNSVAISLPSMARLILYQSTKDLEKAQHIKGKGFGVNKINDITRLDNEESFYVYMQLCSLGILGLYSSLESMVYELYTLKAKDAKVIFKGKELTFTEFTNLGFERKLTIVASQLSGKSNIYGTDLLTYAKEVQSLRSLIQHWDIERRDDYFTNLPANHPLKVFPNLELERLISHTRELFDHYYPKS